MEISNSTNDMNRSDLPKMKKAFVSLQKLEMLSQMPVSEDGSENSKVHVDVIEESEDPSSENVSTGSAESNVVCTDDDDLEKKIQAFSIPVKKDAEKLSSKNESENVKSHSEKGSIIEKGRESIKPGKKQTSKPDKTKEKSALKIDTRTLSEPPNVATSNAVIVSKVIKKKKESTGKPQIKTDNEKNTQPAVPLPDKEQERNPGTAKASLNKYSLDRNLRNGRGDKQNEKNSERKTKKDELEDKVESTTGSEVSRKRKALKDENTQYQAKKLLAEKNSKLLNERSSAQSKEQTKRNTDVKLRSLSIKKKKIIPSKDSPKLSDRSPVHVKRSTRMSGLDNRAKYIGGDTEKKILRSKTHNKSNEVDFKKLQKSIIEARKRHSSSRDRSSMTSKLKNNENGKAVEKKIKEKVSEKSINIEIGKKRSLNSVGKEGIKALDKGSSVRKDSKYSSNVTKKENSKKVSDTKSDNLGREIQKRCSEVFDDGEELLEKICDLLEEASGVPESESGAIRYGAQKLYLRHQGTDFPSNEGRLLIPDAYFFKPRIVPKNSRFPSQGKGTVSYKKLWKWSHYVKMPSNMWSLHKHPDGNFVIVFHISELSPFPKLVIDKCIIFKETASPCVKIYGKDVVALSSDKELQTLGNVCSFLRQIHDISLCEGILSPLTGGNNNCELYTNGKVSLPYKCKSCL